MSRLASSTSSATPTSLSTSNPQTLIPYHLEPPSWRPRLQESSSSLGIPDFYPPSSGHPEDDMSEPTVRSGISSKPIVGNETFSAHDMIYDRLKTGGITNLLGNLFTEIVNRREDLLSSSSSNGSIAAFEHRLPPRVTLNDFKLNSYIKDLADPEIPLNRLSKSVPHGYRGEKMLDMLWGTTNSTTSNSSASNPSSSNSGQTKLSAAINAPRPSVEISRAVWFIRVVGASELQSARSRPNTNYTAEWTSVVTGWLRKQLNELTVSPSTLSGLNSAVVQGSYYSQQVSSPSLSRGPPTPSRRAIQSGSNAFNSSSSSSSSRDSNPLLDVENEKRWVSKWSYSLSLVRSLLQQSLMDQRVFLRWTIEMLSIANISQLPFVLSIVQENSKIYTDSSMLTRSLAESICSKLRDLENAREREAFASRLFDELNGLLKELFQLNPEAFISPRLWKTYRKTLESLLGDEHLDANPKRRQSDFEMVKSRVESLLLLDVDISRNRSTCSEAKIINALDQITASSDLSLIVQDLFQDDDCSDFDKIDSILNWSCTNLRVGIHRPYAAARMLQITFEKGAAARRGKRSSSLGFDPQQILMRWLGEVDSALSPDPQSTSERDEDRIELLSTLEFPSIAILFGELVRLGLFAFPKYLQRLSARGLTSASDSHSTSSNRNSSNNATTSIHTRLLRSIPTYHSTPTIQQQRRTAIYGSRPKESWEEATERRAIRELHLILPWLYRSEAIETNMEVETSSSDGIGSREQMLAALPHLWSGSRFIRIKVISEQLLAPILARPHLLDATRLSLIISIMVEVENFASLSELVLSLLQLPVDASTLSILCSTILQHSTIWTCIGSSSLMFGYLVQLYQLSFSAENSSTEASRTLASTLKSFASSGLLGKEEHDQVAKNQAEFTEIEQQLYNGDLNQIVAMVNHLISSPQDLENTIHSLTQQQSVTIPLTQAVFESILSIEEESDFDSEVLVRLLDWLCIQSSCSLEVGLKRWTQKQLRREGGVTVESPSQSNRIPTILVEMIGKSHLTCQSVILHLIEPSLTKILSNVVGLTRFSSSTLRLISVSFSSLRAVLLVQSSTTSTLSLMQEIKLRGSRSEFLSGQGQNLEILARLLVNLCSLESTTHQQVETSSSSPSAMSSTASNLRSSLSSLSEVRSLVLSRFSAFILCLKNSTKDLWGIDVQSLLNKVVYPFDETSLLLQPALELHSEMLLKRFNPWRQRQTISEIDILAERLLSMDPSFSNKGSMKVTEIAETLYRALFLVNGSSDSVENQSLQRLTSRLDDSLGGQLLQSLSSQQLLSKLVETSLKDTLTSFKSGKADETSSMSSLVRIQRLSSIQPLPFQPSESLTQSLMHVSAYLSNFSSPPQDSKVKESRTDPESTLLAHLRLLSFLFNLNVAWNQQCKNLFPQILCRLLDLSRIFAVREEDEGIFRWLIDLIGFAQEELPQDIQVNTISTFTTHLEAAMNDYSNLGSTVSAGASRGDGLIPKSNSIRLRRLALPSTQNTIFGDLILSRSMSAASKSDFVSAPSRPWNLMEPVQMQSHPSQIESISNSISSTTNSPDGPYISLPISNKASLSLSSFSGQATRDNLPSPPSESHEVECLLTSYRHVTIPISSSNEDEPKIEPSNLNKELPALDPKIGYRFFESERSYGNWKGGEPIYARDARRGMVWKRKDEVEMKLKEVSEEEKKVKEEEEENRKAMEKERLENEAKKSRQSISTSNNSVQKSNVSSSSKSGPASSNENGKPVSRRPKPRSSAGAKAAQKLKDEEQRRLQEQGQGQMEVDADGNGSKGDSAGGKKRKSRGDSDTEDG